MDWTTHTDATEVWNRLEAGSTIEPAVANWLLSAVHRNRKRSNDGSFRYWLLSESKSVTGLAMYSGGPQRLDVSPIAAESAAMLADAVRSVVPVLVGVLGPAMAAAGVAGRWTELADVGARPTDGGRVCEVTQLGRPAAPLGAARLATRDDLEQLIHWNAGFAADTDVAPPPDPALHLGIQIDEGRAWVWHANGRLRSMALLTEPVLATRRLAHVYTPPNGRGQGSAGALVAHLAQQTLDAGERCMLHTQLSNPASNRLYRALGFEAISESAFYEFLV